MIVLYQILALAIVLGIIIFVHELGHYLSAVLMKVRVEVFSFGIGKRLFAGRFHLLHKVRDKFLQLRACQLTVQVLRTFIIGGYEWNIDRGLFGGR